MKEENSITILDKELALKNIEYFENNVNDCINSFRNTMKYLFDELSNYWASPKAVEFYNEYSERYYIIIDEMYKKYYRLCQNMVDSYNSLAFAMGSDVITKNYQIENVVKDIDELTQLNLNANGIEGMSCEIVSETILPSFRTRISYVYDLISSISNYVVFSDIKGHSIEEISIPIVTYKNTIENLIGEFCQNADKSITEQIELLNIAKTEAVNKIEKNDYI